MSFPTVKLIAPAPYWSGVAQLSGNTYVAGSDGVINASAPDVPSLLSGGCQYAIVRHVNYNTPGGPATASATATVSSVTLTPGATQALTIAAQPDMPRQLQALVYGTIPTSAGAVLNMTYIANDGTTQTDVLNITGTNNPVTVTSSKGVEYINTLFVSGYATSTGTTPGIEIGTTAYIAVPLEAGFVDWAIQRETRITTTGTVWLATNETVSTNTISTGMVSPTTAPGSSVQFSFGYTYNMPA